jgi:hypothetical protein
LMKVSFGEKVSRWSNVRCFFYKNFSLKHYGCYIACPSQTPYLYKTVEQAN